MGIRKHLSALVFSLVCFFVLGTAACGAPPEPEPTPTLSAELLLGFETYTDSCAICHAITPDTVIRGPSFDGIATRAATRVPGQDARAYLYNSISRPEDYLVEGYENVMPTTLAKTLSGEELDAVVAYLLTFK